jgi:Domain of unknown function (DUF4189)
VVSKYTSLRNMMVPLVMAISPAPFTSLPSFAQQCLSCVGKPYGTCNCPDVPAPARTVFGAIAYSVSKNAVGFSHGHPNQATAENRAINECKKTSGGALDCKSEIFFYNNCGPIASGDDNDVYYDINKNPSVAVAAAISKCTRNGEKNCQKIASHCSFP